MVRVILISLILLPQVTFAAGFDYTASLNRVESMICGNGELSALDEELNSLYKYIQHEPTRDYQRTWLKKRDEGQSIDCVKTAYRKRLESISWYRIPIKSCKTSIDQISELADQDGLFYIEEKIDLTGDGVDEVIFISRGCNAHCMHLVLSKSKSCYREIASFSAREYFFLLSSDHELETYKKDGLIPAGSHSCLLINDVEEGPAEYQPWCF